VPDRPSPADLAAARRLSDRGVVLLGRSCPASNLLHHAKRQRCGATGVLTQAGIPVAPIVVSDDELQALDLVVARRDRTRIVLADRTLRAAGADPVSTTGPAGGVWVVDPGTARGGATRLEATLRIARRAASGLGLALRPITDARAGK
jgi:hypothetical protein